MDHIDKIFKIFEERYGEDWNKIMNKDEEIIRMQKFVWTMGLMDIPESLLIQTAKRYSNSSPPSLEKFRRSFSK